MQVQPIIVPQGAVHHFRIPDLRELDAGVLQRHRHRIVPRRGIGRRIDGNLRRFLERHGVTGAFAADSAFLRGLGKALGLEPVEAPETDDPVGDLRARVELARQRLDAGDTFVFCHQKTTDAAGHTKDPKIKQETIERLDAALGDLPIDRAIVCVTGDHATPASPDVIHSGDPVPLLVAGPGVRADEVERFGELDCSRGILGQLRGPDLMPVLLNAADRPLFLGSRPTPFDGADGYPAVLEPLR